MNTIRIRMRIVMRIVCGLILSLSLCPGAKAQLNTQPRLLDTIFVSELSTSSIIFPEAISLVDLGSSSFQAATHDKVLLLKAAPDSYGILPTTLLVRFGSEGYFQGFIAYKPRPKEPFYDWRRMKAELPGESRPKELQKRDTLSFTAPNRTSSKAAPLDSAYLGLAFMKSLEREHLSLGEIRHNLELSISNIRHDKRLTYLKLSLRNKSSLPYRISYAGLQLREAVRKKGLRDMISPIEFVLSEIPKTVGPLSTEEIYLVFLHIPSPKKAVFEITLRESEGTRAMELKVPADKVMLAPIIESYKKEESHE